MRRMLIVVILLVFVSPVTGKTLHKEKDYQTYWCKQHKGRMEYVLPDRTRVDCLTAEYAVEVDFARKWAEAIGQALYYAEMTGRKPGILLIMEKKKDSHYYRRLKKVAEKYGISIWIIVPSIIEGRNATDR